MSFVTSIHFSKPTTPLSISNDIVFHLSSDERYYIVDQMRNTYRKNDISRIFNMEKSNNYRICQQIALDALMYKDLVDSGVKEPLKSSQLKDTIYNKINFEEFINKNFYWNSFFKKCANICA